MASSKPHQESNFENTFVSFFVTMPQKSATTIRFFERNDYYTVHGEDAAFVAKEVFKTTSVIKTWTLGSNSIETVNMSKMNFETFVKDLLLVRQYRIEVYRNYSSAKSHQWKLECKASPGNLTQLEELLFGDTTSVVDTKGVIAIKVKPGSKDQVIGLAFGDAILREFKVLEFSDNSAFTDLEAVIIQMSPKECLLSPGIDPEIKNIVKRNNVMLTECKAADFNTSDIMQDLNRLLKSQNNKLPSSVLAETDLKIALPCVAALIRYFEVLSDEDNFGQYTLEMFNSKLYMRLGMSSVSALGLLPTPNDVNKNQSLLGVLNKCRTPQGQRLLHHWIKQPLLDKSAIEHRLNIVESFVNDIELRHTLFNNYLRRIPDLHMIAKKFQKMNANLQDIYKVYQAVSQLPSLHKVLSKHTGQYAFTLESFGTDIKDRIEEFQPYLELVKFVVDLDAVEKGEFIVKCNCDEKLSEVKEIMERTEELMIKEINKVARDLGLEANKTIKLENTPHIGYAFRVTRKEEKAIRGNKNYFTINAKQNGVRFHNGQMKSLNEKYLSLRKSYEKHQKKIVDNLMEVAASYCQPLKLLGETVALLDVYVSFACTAVDAPIPYVRPKLYEKGERGITLKQVRHPCVETQPRVYFIANDIEMKNKKYHIVTGPNMGGKSTYIRSVALNVLMAQIGSFVPCDEAEISIVDAIFTRVGAGDQPIKGVSTFMAEMLEIKNILKIATSDSLIILDELGRGTSTYDGFGLAWAISEYIACQLKSYCLFTTHFRELSALGEKIDSVINSHVTAVTSEDDITFLYQVKPGVCDQSFGIHVAEMAKFPKSVIEFAAKKMKELEMPYSTNGDDDTVPVKKIKFSEENNLQLETFLKKAVEIGKSGKSSEEICNEVKHLKMDFET